MCLNTKYIIPEPNIREARPNWSELPMEILSDIEKITGKIIKAEIAWGGYSPSACFLITNIDGRDYFIKGTHPKQTAHGAKALCQEVNIYENFSFLYKFAPKFYGVVSYGDKDNWILGIWDRVDGSTALPWTKDKVTKLMHLLYDMHSNVKREDVLDLEEGKDIFFVSDFFLGENGWLKFQIYDDSNRQDNFCQLFDKPEETKKWLETTLPLLIESQKQAKFINKPDGIVHFDLRSDNIMFRTIDNKPFILDWTDTCWGAVIFDLVSLIISISAETGASGREILKIYEDKSGKRFPKEDVLTAIAVITGYFSDNIWRETPEKLPRLRWVQKINFDAGIKWFCEEKNMKLPGKFL